MRALLVALGLTMGALTASHRAQAVDAALAPDATAVTVGMSWGPEAIRASRRALAPPAALPPGTAPLDPLDQVVVVEEDGPSLAVFDGRAVGLRGRVALAPRRLAVPPRFSPDGLLAYVAAVDGWVTLVDLVGLRVLAEIRVAERLRGLAVSGDGRWLLAANASPHSLVLLRADLGLERVYALRSADGKRDSAAAAVADAAVRRRFVVALESLPELWEISYDPHAEDIYDGMVHDFRMGEGIPRRGFLGVRRIALPRPLGSLFIDPIQAHALGHAGPGPGDVVNLDVRRRIEALPVAAPRDPASMAVSERGGVRHLIVPASNAASLQVVDMKRWRLQAEVTLPGVATVVRAHAGSARLWALLGAGAEASAGVAVVDLAAGRLETVLGEPGATAVDLDLGRDGRRLWVAARATGADQRDSLLVYEAGQAAPADRLPLTRPVSVQAVANAVLRSQGRVP